MSHILQHRTPPQTQQRGQKSSITQSSGSVLLGSKAEQSHNPSSAQPFVEEREGECIESAAVSATSREKEKVDSVAADSSRSGTPQTQTSESDMERVVKLYMHLAAYSKSRERELFQEVRVPPSSLLFPKVQCLTQRRFVLRELRGSEVGILMEWQKPPVPFASWHHGTAWVFQEVPLSLKCF